MKIVLATHNKDKCAEISALLTSFPIEILSLEDFPEIEEIIDTRIWKLSDKILDDLHVKNDSRLGKKILTFVTNEHFYRSDTIEAMYVKEMEDKITNLCRCGTYVRIKKAIQRSAELIENQKS